MTFPHGNTDTALRSQLDVKQWNNEMKMEIQVAFLRKANQSCYSAFWLIPNIGGIST